MTTLDYAVRLFILVSQFALVIVCFARGMVAHDVRARVGNVAFGSLAAVGCWSQVPLLDNRITTTTWLLAAATCVCIAYIVTIARKGL